VSEGNADLPAGWELVTIGDVVVPKVEQGAPRTDFTYIDIGSVNNKTKQIDSARVLLVGDSVPSRAQQHVQADDILVSMTRPNLNAVAKVPTELDGAICSTGFDVLRPIEVEPDWLFLTVKSRPCVEVMTSLVQGALYPAVRPADVRAHRFALPPLAEQQRIVVKIEALEERSRRAREALLEVGPLLEQFRQSVLAAAFRGDLTADWRAAHSNVEPASELLHRVRAERRRRWEQAELAKYEAKGQKPLQSWKDKYKEPEPVDDADLPKLPEGWTWATIDEICSHIVDCPHSTPQWTDEGKLCVRTTEFHPGKLDLTHARFVSLETFNERIQRLKPQPGDILYSREGGILGISCQVPADTELCLGQRMMLMRTDVHFLSRLLMHWLNSPRTLDRVKRLTLGSASPHLNVGEVKGFPVPVAPIEEHSKLLEMIESCLATPEVCAQMAMDSEQQLDHLNQAILAKAFRGELVPQDPSDEPASVLLERIHAQRIQQAKAPKQASKSNHMSKLGKESGKLEPQQLTLVEVLRTTD
jgi:type I restriction enzyme, S subunit